MPLQDPALHGLRIHGAAIRPLSCFMAGVAAERVRIASPALNDGVIADYIQAVRTEFERDASQEPGR